MEHDDDFVQKKSILKRANPNEKVNKFPRNAFKLKCVKRMENKQGQKGIVI